MNKTSGSPTNCSMQEKWQGNLKAGDKKANIHNDIKFSEWLPELYRVMKTPSQLYVFVNDKNLQDILNESYKAGFRLHNVLVWKKNNCTPNRWYMKNCEFIVFLHKGKSFPIANLGSNQFLEFENIAGKNKLHPTQKPVDLIKVLIENSSKEGDLVLDPFCGSGSTLVSSKKLNRNYIGYDIDPTYSAIAEQRTLDTRRYK